MNQSIGDILNSILKEIWAKKYFFMSTYFFVAMLFLVVGWFWPKVYESSSTILIDQQSILRPLLEGTAVTTKNVNRAKTARKIIFSRKSMSEILVAGSWVDDTMSAIEKERIADIIKDKTYIGSAGKNLIRISFRNEDPMKAFEMTTLFTNIFINQSVLVKQVESQDAYSFIDKQVSEYHLTLTGAEKELKQFYLDNIDARPGTQPEVNDRILKLRNIVDNTKSEIGETKIKIEALDRQLSGEAEITLSLTKEGKFSERLVELQTQLESLRLVYHESYPEIVQIKTQINELSNSIEREQKLRADQKEKPKALLSSQVVNSPLYQELRSKLSSAKTLIATLTTRLHQTEINLKVEKDRLTKINDVETKLAELNRDYDVNQGIYQNLLKQREKARISMNIDQEKQGLSFKIQEKANIPLSPKGLRFAHFIVVGFLLSFLVPTAIIFGLSLLDRKIRNASFFSQELGLVVIGSLHQLLTPKEQKLEARDKKIFISVLASSWIIYCCFIWLRIQG